MQINCYLHISRRWSCSTVGLVDRKAFLPWVKPGVVNATFKISLIWYFRIVCFLQMTPCWTEMLNQELIWLPLLSIENISWVRTGKLLKLWLLCEKAKAKTEYSYFNQVLDYFSFIVYCMYNMYVWSWGDIYHTMHVKLVELVLSYLHVDSGAQTQ